MLGFKTLGAKHAPSGGRGTAVSKQCFCSQGGQGLVWMVSVQQEKGTRCGTSTEEAVLILWGHAMKLSGRTLQLRWLWRTVGSLPNRQEDRSTGRRCSGAFGRTGSWEYKSDGEFWFQVYLIPVCRVT